MISRNIEVVKIRWDKMERGGFFQILATSALINFREMAEIRDHISQLKRAYRWLPRYLAVWGGDFDRSDRAPRYLELSSHNNLDCLRC